MTTLHQKKAQCAVCGTEAEYTEIRSTNSFGSPDLDMRPPEMKRSTIFAWIQRCPGCGYCAPDVSKATSKTPSVVRSPEYVRQLADSTFPELANSFLCKSLLDVESAGYSEAAWSLIHAAWACDDAMKNIQARTCRSNAADMIGNAVENGQNITDQDGLDTAIRVDLLRRAGRLDEARQLIQTQRTAITEGIILKMLDFQGALIARRNKSRHTISEALGENG